MTTPREVYKNVAFTWKLKIPVTQWAAGNYILFAAKRTVDDDPLDSEASFKKTFNDSYIASTDSEYVNYELYFEKNDMANAKIGRFFGEFRIVDANGNGGKPFPTFPVEVKGTLNNRSPV